MKHKTFHVLLVEDDLSDALLVEKALQGSFAPSFVLTHVTRLDEGVEKLQHEDFDLAVLDLALPDSQGWETFFTIRDEVPEVPVVILTGLADYDLALQAFEEGAADCLPKSYLFNGELARACYIAMERTRRGLVRSESAARHRSRDRQMPDLFDTVTTRNTGLARDRMNGAPQKDLATLQASEISYRRLFETAQDGILILDADTGRIRDVNPYLANLLGYSRSEILGQTVGDLSPFQDSMANKAMLARVQEQGYVRYENLPMETRDGRRIAVEFVSNEYVAGDEAVIQCNVRNIMQRKRAEEQVHHQQQELERRVASRTSELKALNSELEAFSYSVSHDLRAPLRHITGFLELLHDSIATSLSEKELQYLTTIAESAERMGELIDNLLAFSHVGHAKLHKVDVDLNEMITDTRSDFTLETRGRTIHWEIGPLPTVWADPALLRLVLVNLLSNALKFTGNRAEARIEIGSQTNSLGETEIFVSDNGAGFDPNYADKLFGVFQRLHSSEEFEGTGIGLANVQRIIQRHGGRIRGEGALEVGAKFTFSLPGKN